MDCRLPSPYSRGMADITKRFPDCDDDGRRGKRGRRGPTGPTGASGGSAIIPFASGEPGELVHVLGGLLDTGMLVGFGSSLEGVDVGSGTIDLTGAVGFPTNMAFSMPRDGTLTQLSAFFSNVLEVLLTDDVSVDVQVYRSTTPDNVFTAIPGAVVQMLLPAGTIVVGGVFSGTVPLAVDVSNQDRLLLVARLTVPGTDVAVSVTGYVSAGLAIA